MACYFKLSYNTKKVACVARQLNVALKGTRWAGECFLW